MRKFFQAVTFTLFLHSFAGWFYIAENAVFHPETLSWGLTHFAPWPREDTFGIICFGVSLVSLFTYMMIRGETIKKEKTAPKELEVTSSEAKASPRLLKTKARKVKAGSKNLKVSANKTNAKRKVRKIKVVELSE